MRPLSDNQIAARTIWQEARGETHEGRVAVAWVIKNRVSSPFSGPNLGTLSDKTVLGACLRAGQFTGWWWKDPNFIPTFRLQEEDPIYQECLSAWIQAQMSETDPTHGALFYWNPKTPNINQPVWIPFCSKTVSIGRHDFYRPKE